MSVSKKKPSKLVFFKKLWELFKDYFIDSDEKLVAWLLLIGTTICVVGLVALMAIFSWWFAGFWAVLATKQLIPILICLGQLALFIGSITLAHVLKNYFVNKLSILWRNWLTKQTINKLFDGENNYLDLKRFSSEIDNISQRIQEDIATFVNSTLHLGVHLLKSVLSLGAFVGTLWVVGGSLAFVLLGLNIVIPGYLVWVAIIIAIAATATTHYIGKSLLQKTKNGERAEADLRKDLEVLNNDAEQIAEEHAENYYKKSLECKIEYINENANEKLTIQSGLVAFQEFYKQISGYIPTLLSIPLYLTGAIQLAQLMQVGLAFEEVSSALSFFVEFYDEMSIYQTSIERVVQLRQAFDNGGLLSNDKAIRIKEKNQDMVIIKGLNMKSPQVSSTDYIMKNLHLKLKPGEHTLIKGVSGTGKSTIFKAISGTWKYGDGKITIPANKHMYFLPQKPTLPYDTLRGVLAYPESIDTYTEEQYAAALKGVGGLNDSIAQLADTAEKHDWSKELSAGQQQRISFARALLKKPDWIFLDECTGSLDEESEQHVYDVLKTLQDTTIVSIAHRQTVAKHHSRIIHLQVNENREVDLVEEGALNL